MRKLFNRLALMAGVAALTISCDAEYVTYNEGEHIMFADSLSVLAIQNSDEIFEITIGATSTCNYDRTLGIEVLESRSNAIEGYHYEILSNTVTIKAGENVTNVLVRGNYDNIQINDSIGFILNIVAGEETEWDLYENGQETKVLLYKTKPFDINDFTGYAVVSSTFLYNYTNSMKRLIHSEVDPENENTIILHDYIYDGYDVKIKFDTTDVLNPLIEMEDQVMVSTGEAFGTVYGDGYLNIYQPAQYTSYYSTNETFIYQYMVVYVPGMDSTGNANVVGVFINAVEWISDDEAEEIKRVGF